MAARDQRVHRVRADEAGAARDQDPHVTPGSARGGRAGRGYTSCCERSPARAAVRDLALARPGKLPSMSQRRFVLLDRDGTLIVERNYLSDPDQVELIPGAAAGLRRLAARGLGLVLVTNQSGIGRGFFDAARLAEIHERLTALLRAERVELDGIYVCPHHPDQACDCRKPRPALVLRAAAELGFDACARVRGGRHGERRRARPGARRHHAARAHGPRRRDAGARRGVRGPRRRRSARGGGADRGARSRRRRLTALAPARR